MVLWVKDGPAQVDFRRVEREREALRPVRRRRAVEAEVVVPLGARFDPDGARDRGLGLRVPGLGSRIWGQTTGFKYTRLAESERGVRLWLENVRYLYTPFQ